MGHDLMLKKCPRPLRGKCVQGGSCGHEVKDDGYLSFNFTTYKNYWCVARGHGHLGRVVSRQLARALAKMQRDGFVPGIPPGGDGWTRDEGVFMLHLARLKDMVDNNPNYTFLSDQCWAVTPLSDEDEADGPGSDEDDSDWEDTKQDERKQS